MNDGKNLGPKPIYIKIKHFKEVFIFYTDEYDPSGKIKKEISLLKNIPFENIRLYYSNKRIIDDSYTNHDQEIFHQTTIYYSLKIEGTNEFESFKDVSMSS